MKSIDIFNLLKISNPNIIDIRDNSRFMEGHIPGSINIPYMLLILKPYNYLNKSDSYYIICDSGKTSLRCCLDLSDKGYSVINIEGGYSAYKEYLK